MKTDTTKGLLKCEGGDQEVIGPSYDALTGRKVNDGPQPKTTNKYFDNKVCDRLAEAGTFAGNNGMKITLDGLGITVERPKKDTSQLTVRRRVGYLDVSNARINLLLELCKELAR